MATQTQPLTREQLAALPDSYFKAVDAKDVDAILSHFADDAILTVQTDHAVFTGAEEIRRMFTDFCDNSVSIFHEIKNIVVEPERREGRDRAELHRRARTTARRTTCTTATSSTSTRTGSSAA